MLLSECGERAVAINRFGMEVSMKLSELLQKLDCAVIQNTTEREITGLTSDSRKVSEGYVFVCIVGAVSYVFIFFSQFI